VQQPEAVKIMNEIESTRRVADQIAGYTYGHHSVPTSPVSIQTLERLKESAGFTAHDEALLRIAGSVLTGQTKQIVEHWRSGIIASIPNLARHSRSPNGEPIPEYLAKSNLRFEQWILDTCLREYDQVWLDYQREIALRHTSARKNQTDGIRSTEFVPFHDIVAFVAVMNETIKPYLAIKGSPKDEVEAMHLAWCKSMQIQIALWAEPYMEPSRAGSEW
jgi:hypothetical protein